MTVLSTLAISSQASHYLVFFWQPQLLASGKRGRISTCIFLQDPVPLLELMWGQLTLTWKSYDLNYKTDKGWESQHKYDDKLGITPQLQV